MPTVAIVAIIVAVVIAGGTALMATHGQEAQQIFQKMAGAAQQQISATISPSNATKITQAPQSNQTNLVVNSSKTVEPAVALLITDAQLYSHVPSHVTVKNNGTDSIVVHQVSYGQYSVLTGDLVLPAGKQQQINLTGIALSSGSSYVLEVSGKGVTNNKPITASQIFSLQEPVTKLEIVNASIYIAKAQYPTLSLVMHNSGMDSISVTGMALEKPISSQLWGHGQKMITLAQNETVALNIQLDAYDYMNSTVQQSQDGTITYFLPKTGALQTLQTTGQSSTRHSVTVSTAVPVKNDYKLSVQVSTATIKIENVVMKVNPATGHSTVSLTFRNNSTHPVVLRSIAIGGANVAVSHWSIPANFVINISTTNTLTLTDPLGVGKSNIGSWQIITATGQFYSGSSIDSGTTEGVVVYATTIAQVTT